LFLPPEVVATVIALAALTYMIGVALLNVPLRRIRSLAWTLIYDGATNIVFLAIAMAIPFFIGLAVQILTGQPQPNPFNTIARQYENYNCWLGTVKGCSSTAADAIQQAYSLAFWNLSTIAWFPIFGHALTTLWWAFLNPTLTMLSGILTFLWILYFLGAFVRSAWLPLTSIGAILYGLPGRIGRGVGAGLIATMLVFYVALPFMPVFVDSFCIPGAGTQGQTDCPPPPSFGPFTQQLAEANKTATEKVAVPIVRILNPNVKFQTSDMNGNPLGPTLLTITNGQGEVWRVWTLSNGTRYYGLPSDTYTVAEVEYLNVTIKATKTVFAAPENGYIPVNIDLPIIPFSVTFLSTASAPEQRSAPLNGGVDHGTHYAPAFLNIGEWRNLQYVSLTQFYSIVADENFIDVTVQGTLLQDGTFVVFFTNSSATLTLDNSPSYLAASSILPDGVGLMYTYTIPAANYTLRQIHMTVSGGAEVKYTGQEVNPLLAAMLSWLGPSGELLAKCLSKPTTEVWMCLQTAQTGALATYSVPFLLRWLLLPTLYLFILGVAASDVAAALGGRRIPIPV